MEAAVIRFRKVKKNKTTQTEYEIINKEERVVSAQFGAKNDRKVDGGKTKELLHPMRFCQFLEMRVITFKRFTVHFVAKSIDEHQQNQIRDVLRGRFGLLFNENTIKETITERSTFYNYPKDIKHHKAL